VQCIGWIELADMVLTQNDVIYGTFVVKYISKTKGNIEDLNQYFIYRWAPAQHDFAVLDVKGMRIAAANSANTLVGSYKDHAALFRQGASPILLSSLVPDHEKEWDFLEATGINDRDQIVGYGLKKGQMHIFLIEPIL
jgi:hypothetical protein